MFHFRWNRRCFQAETIYRHMQVLIESCGRCVNLLCWWCQRFASGNGNARSRDRSVALHHPVRHNKSRHNDVFVWSFNVRNQALEVKIGATHRRLHRQRHCDLGQRWLPLLPVTEELVGLHVARDGTAQETDRVRLARPQGFQHVPVPMACALFLQPPGVLLHPHPPDTGVPAHPCVRPQLHVLRRQRHALPGLQVQEQAPAQGGGRLDDARPESGAGGGRDPYCQSADVLEEAGGC
mmetsp:Transcript_23035/g.59224  ORF Transcript_23035/g.59224 Transcript_23035/m.59224 type:complete len:237 (+) Transcript_23035:726-1436(+)